MLRSCSKEKLEEYIKTLQEDIEDLYKTLDLLPINTVLSRLSVNGAIKIKQKLLDKAKEEYATRV